MLARRPQGREGRKKGQRVEEEEEGVIFGTHLILLNGIDDLDVLHVDAILRGGPNARREPLPSKHLHRPGALHSSRVGHGTRPHWPRQTKRGTPDRAPSNLAAQPAQPTHGLHVVLVLWRRILALVSLSHSSPSAALDLALCQKARPQFSKHLAEEHRFSTRHPSLIRSPPWAAASNFSKGKSFRETSFAKLLSSLPRPSPGGPGPRSQLRARHRSTRDRDRRRWAV